MEMHGVNNSVLAEYLFALQEGACSEELVMQPNPLSPNMGSLKPLWKSAQGKVHTLN